MRHVLLTGALALGLGTLVIAQTQSPMSRGIDAGIARLNDEGANISFARRSALPGAGIRLEDVTIAPDDARLVISAPWVEFRPDGSDRVEITLAPAIGIEVNPARGGPVLLTLETEDFRLSNDWRAGQRGVHDYAWSATSMALAGSAEGDAPLQRIDLSARDLSGNSVWDSIGRDFSGLLEIGDLMVESTQSAFPGGTVTNRSRSTGSTLRVSASDLPEPGEDLLASAAQMELAATSGPGFFELVRNRPDQDPTGLAGTTGAGAITLGLGTHSLTYALDLADQSYVLQTGIPAAPQAIDIGLRDMSMRLVLPARPSEEMQPARLALDIEDLRIDDAAWDLADPEAILPREPANIALDLSGMARLRAPLSVPSSRYSSPMQSYELGTLDLDEVDIALLGARIEAEGAVKLDNSGLVPVPEGEIDLSLEGVQGLVQGLVALNLVPPMQAGLFQGMMQVYATPGPGPDSQRTTITFSNGGISANGMPLR